ncbi:hypothetical protein SAMN00790413_00409 [Deinococcus hopiensis KR-140]|uniref:Uncharacterized protein n=1 Tax=Deinococcus hopiensis KR-140 TaxID=695939 RepID=A0A1W1V829_9DEIO|nr:hypothetical protein SAMN00790413_00409 [Deinococcus hopiensis KR-140]
MVRDQSDHAAFPVGVGHALGTFELLARPEAARVLQAPEQYCFSFPFRTSRLNQVLQATQWAGSSGLPMI